LKPLPIQLLYISIAAVLLAAPTHGEPSDRSALTAEELEFFEFKVRPLLAEHCYQCHSHRSERVEGGLLLDSRKGLVTGGDSGAAIDTDDVDGSMLIEAVRYESYEMPPKGKLPDEQIAVLEKWVGMGAPWPNEPEPTGDEPREVFDLEKRKREHWVWQPITDTEAPKVADASWPRDTIDYFILHKLEEANLRPAADADSTALLRRAYFDLIGLPPTPEQVEQFQQDDRPDAFARAIDELLASPHFGERWGRHWLDLMRYAESRGHEWDVEAPNAHQYRDYVIRALNADVPYDQFVREHIAGDLLEPPRLNPEHGYNESLLGTGFWFLGDWVHSPVDPRRDETDRFDNMIDVMSKTFMGVTVACARCHDHKFDAISTEDYYALCGFLQSSDYHEVRFETVEHNREIANQLAETDATYQRKLDALLSASGVENSPPVEQALGAKVAPHVVVNYGKMELAEFMQNGYLFGAAPLQLGAAFLERSDEELRINFAPRAAAVTDAAWNGLKSITTWRSGPHNNLLAPLPRSGRTLRTPTFTLKHGKLHCRVRGKGHLTVCLDSLRVVMGPLHGDLVKAIDGSNAWTVIDLTRFAGHRVHLEFTPGNNESLEVSLVLDGASKRALKAIEQWESAGEQQVVQRRQAIELLVASNPEVRSKYEAITAAWGEQRKQWSEQIERTSQQAFAMQDGTPEDDHVLIRGSSATPGPVVPRRFLTAISGDAPMQIARGSGRLELAAQMVASDNPLTTRVIVNRIWKHLLGRGIVPSTDDFGVLGERPTHPELLDHLATRFAGSGPTGCSYSLKQMIRAIMLSRSYQMASYPAADAVAADPKNLLWHHRPPKRLEGEVIRDALLAISGRLDEKLFGPPTPIHLTPFMEGRGQPATNGPLDGGGRRSIYISVRRNFVSPFMTAFDTPPPFSSMGRRNVSNVPAQALILMNDPLVLDLAKSWGERALETVPSADAQAERIQWMYQAAFARAATPAELRTSLDFLASQRAGSDNTIESNSIELWANYAHALINTKEFIFLR